MSDFTPETRNASWWSGDSRKAANGKANEVILTKQGKLPIPDLSGIEVVQMGHVMEPVIGRLAQAKLGIELSKIEDFYSHPTERWMKSHFDFVGEQDGETVLVEAKNYNSATRNKFDEESGLMPPADMAQLVHEATVFGCSRIVLAVLFGGAEFVTIPLTVTDQMKEDHLKTMAVYWGYVVSGNTMPPETAEQARLIYPVSAASTKIANSAAEDAAMMLFNIKLQIKTLEDQEDMLASRLQGYMAESESLMSVDGRVLATWKSAKSSTKFSATLFKDSMPEVYNKYVVETPGSRRFLVKGSR